MGENSIQSFKSDGNIPQLIDLHLHAGWTDFDHAAQEKRTKAEQRKRIESFLKEYKKQGIVCARDAGGLSEEISFALKSDGHSPEKNKPDETGFAAEDRITSGTAVLPNCAMLGLGSSSEDLKLIKEAVKQPYDWVKIFATDGVGKSPEDVLTPKFSKKHFSEMVHFLHEHGKRVMVHCYGGAALDWCIEEGVDTIEHAVYMTKEQAAKLARKNEALQHGEDGRQKSSASEGKETMAPQKEIVIVPTTSIYRLLAEKPELFGIPDFIRENAKHAAEAQLKSVKYALDMNICIGYGTDFYADPALLPYTRYELDTLRDCGLSAEQALAAGTINARNVLNL